MRPETKPEHAATPRAAERGSATLSDLLRLGRPHFLLAGFAFVALGIALARNGGATLDPSNVGLALAVVAFTQWGVHYGNEAHDVAADRANAQRTRLAGGSGLIVAGRVSVAEAGIVAACLFGGAAAAAAVLGWREPRSLAVSVPMVALAWAYSAPPVRLCARGLGELATGLIVALLVPALVAIPAGLAWRDLWPLAPIVLQVAAAVTVLSLPDVEGDAVAGKQTLAVRLGSRPTRRLLQATWLAGGLASTTAIVGGAPPTFALAGGASFAAAVALPLLVLRRSWDTLSLVAMGLAALQWGLTLAWALA